MTLGNILHPRPASRRVNIEPDPVAVVPPVLNAPFARLEMLTAERP